MLGLLHGLAFQAYTLVGYSPKLIPTMMDNPDFAMGPKWSGAGSNKRFRELIAACPLRMS